MEPPWTVAVPRADAAVKEYFRILQVQKPRMVASLLGLVARKQLDLKTQSPWKREKAHKSTMSGPCTWTTADDGIYGEYTTMGQQAGMLQEGTLPILSDNTWMDCDFPRVGAAVQCTAVVKLQQPRIAQAGQAAPPCCTKPKPTGA